MQSILQYRRLGREAQQQLDGARHGRQNVTEQQRRTSSRSYTYGKGDDEDVEKQSSPSRSPTPATSPPPNSDIEKDAHTSKENLMSLGDAEDPKKWSYAYKWTVTGLVGSAGFVVAWASAVDSEVSPQIMQEFSVGQEVALLGTTLFMVTFGLGSLISAPFSEVVSYNRMLGLMRRDLLIVCAGWKEPGVSRQ